MVAFAQDPTLVNRATFDYVYGTNDYLYHLIVGAIGLYDYAGYHVRSQVWPGAGHCDEWSSQGVPLATQQIATHWATLNSEITVVMEEPISGLLASNDGPTQVSGVTGLFATISAGDNVSYAWNFGDGSPLDSSGANVSHSYGAVGSYTAIVTASNSVSSQSATTTVTITDVPPLASFTSSSPDQLGQVTSFSNTSTGSNLSYDWNFGDGNSSTEPSPIHTYGLTGTYTVTLTASNSADTDSTSALVTITDVPPLASFTSSSPDEVGQVTTFTNTSTGTNLSYDWNFGDGNSSTVENPTHTYGLTGTYTVTLTASNSAATSIKTATVTIDDVPPLASFTSSSPDELGQVTSFTNNSTGSNLTYEWDFGDGNSSTVENPTHTYGLTGTYTVTLTASNSAATSIKTATATITDVPPDPISDLLASSDSPTQVGGVTGLSATISAGDDVSYLWDFGDGSPLDSSGANVSHTYTQVGTFIAGVFASNSVSTASATTTVTITDVPPLAGFTSSSPDELGQETTFNNTSSGTNLSYLWDFGDGNGSTEPNPTHTYNQIGTYSVMLTVSNSAGSNSTSAQVTIDDVPPDPISGLAASNDSPTQVDGVTGLSATISAGDNVSYEWDFGDGTPPGSGANVSHSYGAVGNYTAIVTASNSVSSESATTVVTITDVPPLASFTSSSPDELGQETTFSNTSSGTNLSYLWDFGDGNGSTEPNPSHTYGQTGTYSVMLTVSNSAGSNSTSAQVTITDVPPLASFTSSSPDELGQETTFNNTSTGTNLSYLWDFGDGNGSTEPNPTHTYNQIGTYSVMLTVSNSAGSNSTSAK